ncbi:MepB family protein [Flavobacterium faecale]|uniref:MepB family protein n=1 Tax=Flavobacterium faecale TaxID=1355330 RepID=UPI003AAD9AC0
MYLELQLLNEILFKPLKFELSNIKEELEGQDYFAHTFQIGKHKAKFRTAKITPTKTGHFVTLWKRNPQGITESHSILDDFDFYIITTRQKNNFGIFIFHKTVLHEKRILSDDSRDGKRGFRVYPSWDNTSNKQAQKTQLWQCNSFIDLSIENSIDLQKINDLLNINQ